MSKLYIFGIGGTGARVLKSLTMLLASGVECGVDTIVPIIIDRDKGNGDYSRTDGLIKSYISVNSIAPKNNPEQKIKNRFFNTDIKLLGNELLLKLDDETKKFEDFIGFSTQSDENKALSQMLFSKDTLSMDTEFGFKGNPNIGSVVLNQFDDKNIFKAFASDFDDGDKIFIISSIFGGTGASGFPLLRKMLQTKNLKDATGTELPKWGLINTAPIGAISVLPYFNVDKKDNVDSDTFNDKTRAALSYYETEDGQLDTLYYIADTNRKAYKYAEGGKEQENDAHFVELSAAMSILDFVNTDKKSENFQKDGDGKRKTIYKEFGINSDVKEISFDNLAAETQKLIVNPLSRFMLFSKYMGYTIVKRSEGGKDKFIAEKVSHYDIFDKQNKYQPYAHGRFVGDFRNNLANIESVQKQFIEWLQEMTQQSRKFAPFNLTTDDAFNFVNGNVSLFTKKDSTYKNWAKVDNQLNKQISKTNKSLSNEKIFIELFYRVTEELINQTSQNNGDGGDKYIFRLQNEGDFGLVNTIEHWGVSDMYGDKQRNAIKSSNENSENQPTSIPSPFARIALVKTAFAEVAAYGDRALHAYKKIVSDTLDIAEIFFTLNKWKSKKVIEVITWDKSKNLPELSKIVTQKILHKTLETFLKNDAITYNYDKMHCIYILKHRETGEMIGATSPSTLFFSSANDWYERITEEDLKKEEYKQKKVGDRKYNITIPLSTHNAFDGVIPLNERSWGFQKYLYTWITANNEIRNSTGKHIFAEVQNYLEAQKQVSINSGRKNATDYEISEAGTKLTSNYKQLRSPDVEVLSMYYYELDSTGDNEDSKLTIKENLSVDDLLESKIIRLSSPIKSDSFFNGNIPTDCNYTYLLPIKDEFFKHYTIEDLRKAIKIGHYTQYANVALVIGGKEYKKEYKQSEGNIIEKSDFDCMLFPNIKFSKNEDAYYRFGLFLPYNKKDQLEKYTVDFYDGKNKIECESPIVRNTDDNENSICKTYSLNQKGFDRIKVIIEGTSGMLLPVLHKKGCSENYTFAVDFGTTNTHIEYKTSSNQTIRPFDISESDKQISFLCGNNLAHTLVADIDFIPTSIGEKEMFKFPVRTALSLQKHKESVEKVFPFTQANVIIPYEKRQVPKYDRVLTQLKWDSTEDEMSYYIDALCFILRNKVILNGGNLSETKIVWFYPLSMAGSRSKIIRNKWKLAYSKYFLGIAVTSTDDLEESQKDILKRKVIELPESVAPFLCYKDDRKYKDAINNLVSIDIGGGTTDIVFIKGGKDTEYVTSFRFAANSVFGLGEQITPIVSKYQSEIEKIILDEERAGDAKYNYLFDNIYRGITGDTQKGDIASFFFALKNHEKLQDVEIDFNSMLKRDSDQKLIFVLFYSAIIYHTAQIMKAKELELPRHIAFSGNGSRIVNIVGDKEILAELSKCIFEKVYDKQYGNSGLDIIQNTKNPKEVTCKGGIKAADKEYEQKSFEPLVLLGTDNDTFITDSDTYSSVDIEESLTKTNNKVKEFIEYVINELMLQKYTKGVVAETFVKAMNINQQTLQIAKEVLMKEDDLANFTRNGINNKIASIVDTSSTQIEETFFFYPIASLLNVISNEINKKD